MGLCWGVSSNQFTSKAAAVLGSVRSASKTAAARKNGQLGGRPAAYRRFHSGGFLRLSKLQPADGGDRYLLIGSFAGPDAVAQADELERRDRAGEHRHPYDRTATGGPEKGSK